MTWSRFCFAATGVYKLAFIARIFLDSER